MHREDNKCIQNQKIGRDHLRDLGVEGQIILKWILISMSHASHIYDRQDSPPR